MHIIHSAVRTETKRLSRKIPTDQDQYLAERYLGYLAACNKHRQTIAAIQQYLPGWEPQPPAM